MRNWNGCVLTDKKDYPVAVTNATSIRNDREYVSTIGFGTPQQRLNVDFDTGSADV